MSLSFASRELGVARTKVTKPGRRAARARNGLSMIERLEDRTLLSGFSSGSIQGQDGWSGGTIPIPPQVVQTVDQTGTNAHTGVGAWQVSNSTANGGYNGNFSGWPFGPGLAVSAGQPSSGAGADRFSATYFFKSANTVADGSNIEVDLGTTDGLDRNTFMAITNRADGVDGGLQIRMAESDLSAPAVDDHFYPTQIVVTGISRGVWHRIDVQATFINGVSNDTFQVSLDGGAPITNTSPGSPNNGTPNWGTFEAYRNGIPSPYEQSNRLYFRSGAAPSAYGAFSDTAAAGFYFDDLSYKDWNSAAPSTILASYAATFEPATDLVVTKFGTASAIAGNQITYTIIVTNNGPHDAQTVALTDTLPAGTTFVSQGQGGGPTFTLGHVGNAINDTIATLPAGASQTFTVTARLLPSDANGSTVSNTATVGSATIDSNPGNNSSTATTSVQTSADLALTVTSAPAVVPRGGILTYTVTVTNNGPSDASHVLFNDSLPSATTFVSQTQGGGPTFTLTNVGNSIGDSILTMPAGTTQTFTIMTKVKTTATVGASLSNSAAVFSFTPDPNFANNASMTTNTVGNAAPTVVVPTLSVQAVNASTPSGVAGAKSQAVVIRMVQGPPHSRPAQPLPAWWRQG